MKECFKKFFPTVLRQNQIAWGKDLTNDELEIINDRIRFFYLNGNSIETAPLPIKCDVRYFIVHKNLTKKSYTYNFYACRF